MEVDNKHLDRLKQQVEEAAMLHPLTSIDFDRLHDRMQERLKEAVGVSTLKRLWGYIDGYATVRESTLDVLCRFAGYPDWHTFVADYCQVESAQTSHRVLSAMLTAEQLPVGEAIEIGWEPNRRLRLRHEGNGCFTVLEASNSKVKAGDTFHCDRFMLNQPLYIDNMRHGTDEPTLFVLGKKGGLSLCQRAL